MAGNKFRDFRSEKESKKKGEEDINIERNSNIVFTTDYEILTKPKNDPKYHSNIVYKKGTLAKVLDNKIISNKNPFVKILLQNNNKSMFGYIPLKDGIIKPYELSNDIKDNKMKTKSNIETFGSIKLCDAKITNDENIQKNQEDIKCYKKVKELENKIISFVVNINQNEQENSNSPKSTNVSNINISQTKVENNDNNQEDPFNVEDCFNINKVEKKSELKAVQKINKINANVLKEQFCSISKNYCNNKDNNFSQNLYYNNSKEFLVNYYLILRELKKIKPIIPIKNKDKEQSLSLEPKYQKGVQVIYIPLKLGNFGKYLYEEKYVGHIFCRYYDQKKGIDMIIESNSNIKNKKNEIEYKCFKKEELTIFDVVQEEELKGGNDYFEQIKEILIKEEKSNYDLKTNCCFHTAQKIMILFGKSGDVIKKMHEDYILPIADEIIQIILKYLKECNYKNGKERMKYLFGKDFD